jgi:hypothetical protein
LTLPRPLNQGARTVMHLRWALGGVLLSATLAMTACGDDTILILPDAGGPDATTSEASPGDDSGGGDGGGCTPFDASGLDDAAVSAGGALVTALKCRKCHGDLLSGNPDGVQSIQTEGGLAYPPNLTPDPATGLGCWTNGEIQNAFLDGVDNEGQPLCPPMPHFAEAGVDAAAAAEIVAYLRSLHAVTANIPNTPSCTFGAPGGDDGGAGDDGGTGDGAVGDGGTRDASSVDASIGDAGPDANGGQDSGADVTNGASDAAGE